MATLANDYPPHMRAAIEKAEAKLAGRAHDKTADKAKPICKPATEPVPRRGRMNKIEAAYELVLRARKQLGEVEWYGFEAVKLRLAEGAWYTPDFTARFPGGLLVHFELKGFMREAAAVRIKVAAEQHRWASFVLVRAVPEKHGGGWIHKPIGPRAEEGAH